VEKVSNQTYPAYQTRILDSKRRMCISTQNLFSSVHGVLSFYSLKSFSRILLYENIIVKGVLKEDGAISIYLGGEDENSIPQIRQINKNLKCKYGLGFIFFPDIFFFNGSLMDGFEFDSLSENISTFIVNGDMISFNKVRQASSIAKLKRMEDTIYLNSSITILSENVELDNIQKYSKSNLGIDISMQFKRGIK